MKEKEIVFNNSKEVKEYIENKKAKTNILANIISTVAALSATVGIMGIIASYALLLNSSILIPPISMSVYIGGLVIAGSSVAAFSIYLKCFEKKEMNELNNIYNEFLFEEYNVETYQATLEKLSTGYSLIRKPTGELLRAVLSEDKKLIAEENKYLENDKIKNNIKVDILGPEKNGITPIKVMELDEKSTSQIVQIKPKVLKLKFGNK